MFDVINDNITTIAIALVAIAFLLRFLSRRQDDEVAEDEVSPRQKRRRNWGDDDDVHYDLEKDHFREDERYDFVDDDEDY